MRELAYLLNEMRDAGVVLDYAWFGAIALSVGRAKDFARVLALLESGSVGAGAIASLATRHGLTEAWQKFRTRFLEA